MSETQWYKSLRQPMTLAQRKALVKSLTPTVLSSLRRPELLMDFFTDNLATTHLSLTIPSLSGLFTLITTRNLDYPLFYTRLYALLDARVLHSTHRSRVLHSTHRSRLLRHLDAFLAPTNHLSSNLIASFIKRLSRLALHAPPAAIVAVIPLIYNLLKQHPTTTFMVHRHPYPPYTPHAELGEDPYSHEETDPEKSGAVYSSLWELHTLQDHWHPTVAVICRVISEQFTKQEYNVEDFLDHSYKSLLESELAKESKRAPVVEWKIPKKVFEGDQEGDVLGELWSWE